MVVSPSVCNQLCVRMRVLLVWYYLRPGGQQYPDAELCGRLGLVVCSDLTPEHLLVLYQALKIAQHSLNVNCYIIVFTRSSNEKANTRFSSAHFCCHFERQRQRKKESTTLRFSESGHKNHLVLTRPYNEVKTTSNKQQHMAYCT